MVDPEHIRLLAWGEELLRVHRRLRDALVTTRRAVASGQQVDRDLLLLCHGFCVALSAHHSGEDRTLFPAIERDHPELQDVLRALQQDHSMIAHLLDGLEHATRADADAAELEWHLDGVAAIMESHFRYEERQLLAVLAALRLDLSPDAVLGPL